MSFLVNGIKAQAEGEEDADLQKRLLAAAKNLADATAKMVEAAKVSSKILWIFFQVLMSFSNLALVSVQRFQYFNCSVS
jgi:hypothetical protein